MVLLAILAASSYLRGFPGCFSLVCLLVEVVEVAVGAVGKVAVLVGPTIGGNLLE